MPGCTPGSIRSPSGDPLKATAKTEQQAHIELGRLLKEASEGRTPESDATVAKLLDEYAAIAPWDVSTRQTNGGFIRRTIKPALGHLEVRKVRGPSLIAVLTAEALWQLVLHRTALHRHRNVPSLVINPRDRRPPWQRHRDSHRGHPVWHPRSGRRAVVDHRVDALQGIGTGIIRHALAALAEDGLTSCITAAPPVVAGDPSTGPRPSRRRPRLPATTATEPDPRARLPPMKPSTIRGIHSILSGAFAAAKRWEWTERNPAESAKPPTTTRKSVQATSPEDVAKVIAEPAPAALPWACTCGWSSSPASAAASCAACRSATSTSTAAWCMSPSTMSSAVGSASARTPRLTRTAGSPSTRKPAR